jgi:hypothetical protein
MLQIKINVFLLFANRGGYYVFFLIIDRSGFQPALLISGVSFAWWVCGCRGTSRAPALATSKYPNGQLPIATRHPYRSTKSSPEDGLTTFSEKGELR